MQNDKIVGWSKLKGFADDKLDMGRNTKFALERIENVGKKENAV